MFKRETYRADDILRLRGLVSTGQKQQKSLLALRIVDPVPRTVVHLQFGHAVLQVAMRAWIAVDQPIDPHEDAGSAFDILQAINPVKVLVGFLDAHGAL